MAEEVSFRRETNIELEADLEAVDTTAFTVTALGMTFQVNENTQLEDDGSSPAPTPFTLAGLNPGSDDVEIRGYRSGASLIATRVVRLDASTDVELEGPISVLSDPNVSVVDLEVDTDADPVIYKGGATNQTEFFTNADIGDIVELEGTQNAGVINWLTLKLDN